MSDWIYAIRVWIEQQRGAVCSSGSSDIEVCMGSAGIFFI